jgi:hypothetical protein
MLFAVGSGTAYISFLVFEEKKHGEKSYFVFVGGDRARIGGFWLRI